MTETEKAAVKMSPRAARQIPEYKRPSLHGGSDWLQRELEARLEAMWVGMPSSTAGDALAGALHTAVSGGKLLRPRLVVLVHDALGGVDHPALIPVAAATELLHAAFVVHDDVIDGDELRRGAASVPGRFRAAGREGGLSSAAAHHHALAGAILTGDLALGAAVRAIATAPLEQGDSMRLLDLLERVLAESATGELADVRYAMQVEVPSFEEALRMVENKTAAYSFALPMQAGGILAGASPAAVEAVGEVARLLGTAFQLRDDMAGIFGDPVVTGKSDLGDLREGKRTPLMVHARTTAQWPRIAVHVGDPDVTQAQAAEVKQALEEGGSRAFVERLVAQHEHTAELRAHALGLPATLVRRVKALCWPVDRDVA